MVKKVRKASQAKVRTKNQGEKPGKSNTSHVKQVPKHEKDPMTDNNVVFIGGIRGTKELEKRCKEDCKAAFSMFPTSMEELMAVADEGRLMPPKSTWFEPKIYSGLFINLL